MNILKKYFNRIKAMKALELGDKCRDTGEYILAIERYNEAITRLDQDPVDQSYRKARIFERAAFCFEMLGDMRNREKCYGEAAENYSKIHYFENAKMCMELRMSPGLRLLRKKM